MTGRSLSDLTTFEDYCWNDVTPAELLAIYAPYRRERRIPDLPALLLLHKAPDIALGVQADWTTPAGRLLAEARAVRMPVIHSLPARGQVDSGLAPGKDELVIGRIYDSAFMATDLAASLVRMGRRGLVLCGATTSGAVRATAVECKAFAFKAAIAQEATGDEASLLHRLALFDIAHKYADVMSLSEMLGLMRGGAETGN